MKNLKKISSIVFASLFAISVVWLASLAMRGYCSWGIEGFTGYALVSYVFLTGCYLSVDEGLSADTDYGFKEELENF